MYNKIYEIKENYIRRTKTITIREQSPTPSYKFRKKLRGELRIQADWKLLEGLIIF